MGPMELPYVLELYVHVKEKKLGRSLASSSGPFRLARVPSVRDEISCRHTFLARPVGPQLFYQKSAGLINSVYYLSWTFSTVLRTSSISLRFATTRSLEANLAAVRVICIGLVVACVTR